MSFPSVRDLLTPVSARPRRARLRPPAPGARLRLEKLEDRSLPSTLVVTNALDTGAAGDGSLRGEIAAAASGDRIVFDPSLNGQTITLAGGELAISQSLTIQGPGAGRLTVSGNNAGRVFDLTGSGANVTIAGLTIANGLAAQGGGIENPASTLTLFGDVLSNNQAVGAAGTDAQGGGVFNGSAASLRALGSVFTNNVARGGDGISGATAGTAYGGALFNRGTATLNGSTFSGNEAVGGSSTGLGGSGFGGAITNDVGGTLTVRAGNFVGNQAVGGTHGKALPPGNPFSVGDGAAIDNDAALVVRGSAFIGNQTHGGAGLTGTPGGNGGAGAIKSGSEDDDPAASATVTDSTFLGNEAIGGPGGVGAAGAQAACGAFLADHGVNVLSGCTFLGNEAVGGAGGAGANGGPGRAGALRLGPRDGSVSVVASDCLFADNDAVGGAAGSGGVGGLGEGGAIANVQISANDYTSTLTLRDCVLVDNEAIGGAGAVGGVGRGGAISNAGGPTLTIGGISTAISDSLFFGNGAQGGDGSAGNGGNGLGGGLFSDKTAVLTVTGSTVTGNEADGGAGAAGFSDGKGQGGGAYFAPGADVCIDLETVIIGNHASTTNDDVFGTFTNC